MGYCLLDEALEGQIAALPDEQRNDWLFLLPHPDFPGRWLVDSLGHSFVFDFEEQIGPWRAVSPAGLEDFLARACDLKYSVAFVEDPRRILDAYGDLKAPPEFSLNSDLPGTIQGFLPFQLEGFNYLRRPDLRGGIALWSTGVGKTALAAALIKQHLEIEDYDLCVYVVKKNNKYGTFKKLEQLGGIDYSHIFAPTGYQRDLVKTGPVAHGREILDDYTTLLDAGEKVVIITNYEKLRDYCNEFCLLVDGRKVVFVFDEMPTKLSNRSTVLYGAIHDVLYDTATAQVIWDERRPTELRSYCLSATPIENNPTGLLNQVRLLDPDVWPTISGWEQRYVTKRNRYSHLPEKFDNLERMGMEIEHMTHVVDKEDPEIATMFPKVFEITEYIDWDPQDRKVYDQLEDIAKDLARRAKEDPTVKVFNPLQLIGVLQMLCDAPSMIQRSAENRAEFEAALIEADGDESSVEIAKLGSEAALILLDHLKGPLTNDRSTKLETLKEWLTVKRPGVKTLLFSRLAGYIQPILTDLFDKWGVSYVVFRGTDRQRELAVQRFRSNPDIQVFLSSDAGSDSIDLPEARLVIDFDLPLKWSTKVQRRNRAHRVTSQHEYVEFVALVMAESVEERIEEIIDEKAGFHYGTFAPAKEISASARTSEGDLMYVLTGERESD